MALPEEIFCDNDLPIAVGPVSLRSFSTGAVVVGTGLTVRAMICSVAAFEADPIAAAPIHEALRILLAEGTGPDAGTYFGGWDGALLTTHLLPTYSDQFVYIVVYSGQDFRVAGQVRVRAIRPVDEA